MEAKDALQRHTEHFPLGPSALLPLSHGTACRKPHTTWHELIIKGCQAAEERLTLEAQQKRELRKARPASALSQTDTRSVLPVPEHSVPKLGLY